MGIRFPNETTEYRAARNRLLQPELELRRQMEEVAAELRRLPDGGEVPEDYVFQRMGAGGAPEAVRMSELFRGRDTLMIYHYMFPRHSQDERPGPPTGPMAAVPLADGPCPSCTALIDMWEGTMPHFEVRREWRRLASSMPFAREGNGPDSGAAETRLNLSQVDRAVLPIG
jgi:predicted dithiol-disulfide oxidoreductase (DUF899 family)